MRQHGRHKKQSGGHGQFGDVIIEIRPLGRGEGFLEEKIHGGSVRSNGSRRSRTGCARRWSRAARVPGRRRRRDPGRRQLPQRRQLELAFRLAGRLAMHEALAEAHPHLLEPMHKLTVACPSSSTSRITSAVAGRRGQMLGLGPRDGWAAWDRIEALIPEAELSGLEASCVRRARALRPTRPSSTIWPNSMARWPTR